MDILSYYFPMLYKIKYSTQAVGKCIMSYVNFNFFYIFLFHLIHKTTIRRRKFSMIKSFIDMKDDIAKILPSIKKVGIRNMILYT